MRFALHLMIVVLLITAAWIDWKTMEIPDELNAALAVCGICSMFAEPEISVLSRIIGSLCVSVPMYLMIRLIPGSFGGGDVKLTFAMGLCLGWRQVLLGTFLAFLFGGTQAMYLLVSGKARVGEGAHMAFGPALCAGYLIAMVCGDRLLLWYLSLFY